jgi:hypothetical protein
MTLPPNRDWAARIHILIGHLGIVGRHKVREDQHLDSGPFGDSPRVLR